jgi:hypothetical protein
MKTPTVEYVAWGNMMSRTTNPNHVDYMGWGGRGIKVHPSMQTYKGFLAVMGERPTPQHSLDRIDNNRGYEPGNVRWATARDQARNRRSNRIITCCGETHCLAEWAENLHMNKQTIWMRINVYGWTTHQALSTPVKHNGRIKLRRHPRRRRNYELVR